MELKDICQYVSDRVATTSLSTSNYISTENMLPNKGGVVIANGLPVGNAVAFAKDDVLVSNIRPYFKKIWQANKNGGCSADVLCFRKNENVDNKYFYYLLSQQSFFDHMMLGSKGCKMPRGDKKQIMNWSFDLPSLEEQKRIADILSSLDSKIELNRRINDNLEQQAQTLFDYYFSADSKYLSDSERGVLTNIAVYLNGLAMQKFPPTDSEHSLPVLKIKELGQGKCDNNSDRCSSDIDSNYVIDNGNIIFSWSGTLMVDVWCGGKCGLNQHLFKVTPLQDHPQWFIYYWTIRHLNTFKLIAKDKAVTMGHIKRVDLEKAEVIIPNKYSLVEMNAQIEPLYQSIINNRLQIAELETLRDALLPKLMSGELKINNLNC